MRRPKQTNQTAVVLTATALALGAVVVIAAIVANLPSAPQSAPAARKSSKPNRGSVSYANYKRVRDGMSRDEVLHILGNDFEPSFEFNVTGITGSEVLQWTQAEGRVAIVGFTNGRVTSRSQVNLK